MASENPRTGTATVNAELKIGDHQIKTRVTVPAGPTRLVELLPIVQQVADKIVDSAVDDAQAQGACISCKKGCGACCRQLVPISEVEARWIRDVVDGLPEPRRSRVRARFAEARRRLDEVGLLDKLLAREEWDEAEFVEMGSHYFRQGIGCPFLEDESCSIHAQRPISCREYLVTSPAENCACPTKDNIRQVKMPLRVWTSLARFDMINADAKYIRWVPLVLAPQWADANPEDSPTREGPELLRDFFEHLAGKKAPRERTPASLGLLRPPDDVAGSSDQPAIDSKEKSSLTSYEDVPYESKAHYPMHPDCIATHAGLSGMRPAPPDRCRVLELGCATGGNLLPMAELLPESRFAGIDLSASQIARGQEVVEALGLSNIELRPASILDVDDRFGEYDYIICHGVYSWVPEEVQEKILAICAKHLAPQGVAYISYNTYPGWYVRGMVRDMLRFHARRFEDPPTRVQQARAFLEFLVQSAASTDKMYIGLLKEEADLLRDAEDYYLFHEQLEDVNQPVYFHEFAERLGRHRLQYLGEAWFHTDLARFPADVQNVLRGLSNDRVMLEQYTDFLTNRTFRRSLICRGDVSLQRHPPAEMVRRLKMSALSRPPAEPVDVRSDAEATFTTDEERTIRTNIPLVKAALVTLFEAWPSALTYDELLCQSLNRLDPSQRQNRHDLDELLAANLLQCYSAHTVALHTWAPKILLQPSPRPRTTRLARYQTARDLPIVNTRHCMVRLGAADRAALRLLDGQRDRASIVEGLERAIREEGLPLDEHAPDGTDRHSRPLDEWLEGSLSRLARSALLVG